MQTKITFRHFRGQHPELHDIAIEMAENLEKYYDGIISANVDFVNETDKTVQFTVHVQGNTLVVKEKSDDFKKSLNLAEDKMIRQLRKYKTKHTSVKV